jgi:hypothetical protein
MAAYEVGFFFETFYLQLDSTLHGLGQGFSFYSVRVSDYLNNQELLITPTAHNPSFWFFHWKTYWRCYLCLRGHPKHGHQLFINILRCTICNGSLALGGQCNFDSYKLWILFRMACVGS